MPLQVAFGDRFAVLVGELERPADRGARAGKRLRSAAGDDQDHREAQDEPRQKCGENEQQTRGARVHGSYCWRMILSENRPPLFGIMRLETRRDAGRNDLVEYRRAVMRPECERRSDEQAGDSGQHKQRA